MKDLEVRRKFLKEVVSDLESGELTPDNLKLLNKYRKEYEDISQTLNELHEMEEEDRNIKIFIILYDYWVKEQYTPGDDVFDIYAKVHFITRDEAKSQVVKLYNDFKEKVV